MLVGDDVVLILRVDGLVLGRDVDLIIGEAVLAEVLEEVGVALVVEVDIRDGGVFVLQVRREVLSVYCSWSEGGEEQSRRRYHYVGV